MRRFYVTVEAFGHVKSWYVEGVDAADARAKALKEVGLTVSVKPAGLKLATLDETLAIQAAAEADE